ncbi:Rho-type GTPase activating protein Rga1 [Malassezia sp. CBS 17886]|nr:Rho-type GTPase activating protein Rga1 [Malassezia sp. CBS 17886]
MTGQFVRALGVVYHLDCFRCADCGNNVASKFFSATADMTGAGGERFPLCETDYFRRLDLLCAHCGRALRGSYITALGAKFHVEHFTCCVCPTVFGPDDSYYEHNGSVYCHFHYSTRFAIQCAGCHTAILKQFVELNRNNVDEHWHPECYMIHRYWKIRLAPVTTPKESLEEPPAMPGALSLAQHERNPLAEGMSPQAVALESIETPGSLLQKQRAIEARVFIIWRVLSAYEESSAACISDMLRHVSNGKYLGGVQFARRFVLHVEVLFAAIDALDAHFRRLDAKSIQYVREARMLCKKIVHFFSLFSHTQESGASRMGITQELLELVTGLAHYLKILIRVSLTGALRLEQDYGRPEALDEFLASLEHLVARAAQADVDEADLGYASLPPQQTSDARDGATDLCMLCVQTVEEDCVRVGTPLRWHWGCIWCVSCRRRVLRADGTPAAPRVPGEAPLPETPPPVPLGAMTYKSMRRVGDKGGTLAHCTYCRACAPPDATRTFATVSRLEQYAFLLCVALNRLQVLLQKRASPPDMLAPPRATSSGASGASGSSSALTEAESSTYRKSQEFKRIESLYLDQRMSSMAKLPRVSTVVGSPAGFHTQPSDVGPMRNPWATDTAPAPAAEQQLGRVEARLADTPSADGRPAACEDGAVPVRAPFTRNNTDVLVREEGPSDTERDRVHGGRIAGDEGLTLADIPLILQAEQGREQQGAAPARVAISSLSLEEMYLLKHVALLRLQRSVLMELVAGDEVLEFIQVRKPTFWGKLFKGGKDRRDVRKKGVFGVALETLVERSGADSTLGATPTPMRIPSFVDDVISAMRQMDVSVEGIFRKNGNVRRLRELAEMLDREQDAVNLLDDNPVQLAALLKKFFRELPDPLLSAKLYRLLVATQDLDSEDEGHRLLQLVLFLLPRAHRDTMEVLFVFLRWVASFSNIDEETGSRMDLHNLATVMCPSLLYARSRDPSPGDALLANRVVARLLERQDDFWVLPDELAPVLRDRALVAAAPELTAAELLRRCAKYATN